MIAATLVQDPAPAAAAARVPAAALTPRAGLAVAAVPAQTPRAREVARVLAPALGHAPGIKSAE